MGTRGPATAGAAAVSRRRTTIALLAACAPLLVACGAGFDAQTSQVYQPAIGVNDRSGEVFVINALVVTDGSGTGTVVAALVNTTDEEDVLVEVVASSTSGAPLESSDLGEGIDLPPSQAVQLGNEGLVTVTATGAAAEGQGEDAGGVEAGSFVTLQFVFDRARVVEVSAPVVDRTLDDDLYADVPTPSSDAGTE